MVISWQVAEIKLHLLLSVIFIFKPTLVKSQVLKNTPKTIVLTTGHVDYICAPTQSTKHFNTLQYNQTINCVNIQQKTLYLFDHLFLHYCDLRWWRKHFIIFCNKVIRLCLPCAQNSHLNIMRLHVCVSFVPFCECLNNTTDFFII